MQDTPKKPGVQPRAAFDRHRVLAALNRAQGIDSTECLLLRVLLDFSNPGHDTVWPSQSTMAGRMKASRGTVNAALAELVKRGILVKRGTMRAGQKILAFNVEAIESLATVEKPRSGRGGYRPKRHAVEATVSGEVPTIHERANDALDAPGDETGTYP